MEGKRKPRLRIWLIAALALLVLYALGVGPIFSLAQRGYIPKRWFLWLYSPFMDLVYENEAATEWFHRYTWWWFKRLSTDG